MQEYVKAERNLFVVNLDAQIFFSEFPGRNQLTPQQPL